MSDTEALAKLRAPFAPNHISKLPKPSKAQTEAVKQDFKKGVRCKDCGTWHHPDVVHLDYVGHAALTDRLLDTDPLWSWEPVAFRDGLPAFDGSGGLWIKLTVCGVTRLGYGHAAAKPNGDPGAREKEVIGDALRNAAMRFGAALDLWHKGDLHADEEPEQRPAPKHDPAPRQSVGPVTGTPVAKPITPATASQAELAHAAASEAITAFEKMTINDSTTFDQMMESKKYKTIIERLRADYPELHTKVTAARDAAFARMDDVPF